MLIARESRFEPGPSGVARTAPGGTTVPLARIVTSPTVRFVAPRLTAADRKKLPRSYAPNAHHLVAAPKGAVREWTFADGLPDRWTLRAGVGLRPTGDGLRVATTRAPNGYLLTSPPFELPPGRYKLALSATIDVGGLGVGALDVSRKRCCWLGYSHYWYGQKGVPTGWMGSQFTIAKPKQVALVFTNWGIGARRSGWLLRRIVVARA